MGEKLGPISMVRGNVNVSISGNKEKSKRITIRPDTQQM